MIRRIPTIVETSKTFLNGAKKTFSKLVDILKRSAYA